MEKYQDVVTIIGPPGLIPIVGANVAVSQYGVVATTAIYSDNGSTLTGNPLRTDSSGRYSFYAPDGHYSLEVSGTGLQTTTLSDITLFDGTGINVRSSPFNAIGDGVADDTNALQAAINLAMVLGRTVFIPAGTYRITSPLFCYIAGTFITVFIQGEGISGRSDKAVIINHASITTAPAIIVQGARVVDISGIQFSGPNICTPATWFAASEWAVSGVRDSRYSPQCAIAIDPFANAAPADGGYPGYAAYYAATALASSRVNIWQCRFKYQVVGIFNGNLVAANNENGTLTNLSFETCKTAIAIGQIQYKGWVFTSIFADLCYTVLDTYTYSDRNGSAGFLWLGGDVSRCNSIIRTLSQLGAAASITQNWKILGLYAEGIWTIGWIGDTSGFAYIPGEFDTCTFWFTVSDTQRADANLVNFAPLKFNTCTLWNPTLANGQKAHAIKIYHESKASSGQKSYLTIENTRFMSDSLPLFPNAALIDVEMHNDTNHSATGTNNFRATFSNRVKVSQLNDITNQAAIWPGSLIENQDTGALIYVKQGMNTVSLGNLAITVNGFNGSFTAADSTTCQTGDIIYATNQTLPKIDGTTFTAATWPVGVVTNASSASISIEDVGPSASTGSMSTSINYYPRMHPPSTIVTHSNTTVEITISGNGSPWQAGDRLQAAPIPIGCYITSGSAPNYIISKAATSSAGPIRCFDADASTITQVAL